MNEKNIRFKNYVVKVTRSWVSHLDGYGYRVFRITQDGQLVCLDHCLANLISPECMNGFKTEGEALKAALDILSMVSSLK
nr:hypothetical protein [uncultured Dysosmobacter sp.]